MAYNPGMPRHMVYQRIASLRAEVKKLYDGLGELRWRIDDKYKLMQNTRDRQVRDEIFEDIQWLKKRRMEVIGHIQQNKASIASLKYGLGGPGSSPRFRY